MLSFLSLIFLRLLTILLAIFLYSSTFRSFFFFGFVLDVVLHLNEHKILNSLFQQNSSIDCKNE